MAAATPASATLTAKAPPTPASATLTATAPPTPASATLTATAPPTPYRVKALLSGDMSRANFRVDVAALQEQLVVDRLLAQLVLDDEQLLAVLLAQDPIEQRRLASTQEARHDRHGQPTVGRARVLLRSG